MTRSTDQPGLRPPAPRSGPHTFEDFCLLVREDQKADLLDGVIYMASPENTDANELFMWLGGLIDLYAEAKDLGTVFGSRVAFRINDKNGPEPDIAFVSKARLHLVERGGVNGPPDLAVEIVSPDSIQRDYEKKKKLYQDAGVLEYWIIDEMDQRVLLLRLDKGGEYKEVRPRKGVLTSRALPGFWLRPEWLWQSPRPQRPAVLAEVLAGQG